MKPTLQRTLGLVWASAAFLGLIAFAVHSGLSACTRTPERPAAIGAEPVVATWAPVGQSTPKPSSSSSPSSVAPQSSAPTTSAQPGAAPTPPNPQSDSQRTSDPDCDEDYYLSASKSGRALPSKCLKQDPKQTP
jgi:hypothetical protein